MKKEAIKQLIKILVKTVLFFALLHLSLLFLFSVIFQRLDLLNVFNIIGLNMLFPHIGEGLFSNIVSIITVILVFSIFYFIDKNSK